VSAVSGVHSDGPLLVTGASGFIGSRLAERLVDAGAEVHGISRSPRDDSRAQMKWRMGDLRDRDFVESAVEAVEPTMVYHLAALVTGSRDLEVVTPLLEHNLLATVNLLMACARTHRPRVVLVGSIEQVDSTRERSVPHSPYAAAKGSAAMYGRMFHQLYDLPVAGVRPAMVYGPGQTDLTKLVPYTTISLLRGESPRILNPPRRADWVYVDDVVEGLLAAGRSDSLAGRSVQLGTGRLTSVREVVTLIDELVDGSAAPDFGKPPSERPEHELAADTETAAELLGWECSISLEEGLRRTVEWYREELSSLSPGEKMLDGS
jgi:nucleoside-diphosphate-sugar epimerase